MSIELSWGDFKDYLDGTKGEELFQEVDDDLYYYLWFDRGGRTIECRLYKVPERDAPEGQQTQAATDLAEYLATWQALANVDPHPHTSDGKPINQPNLFPGGTYVHNHGVGDDITNGVIGAGQELRITRSTSGDQSIEWQYMEWVYLAGAIAKYGGAAYGDYFACEINAPATVGTSNPGAGDYNKQAVGGGASIFVPTTPGAGDWDLDLEETLNANVEITKVTPVPVDSGGMFDWDPLTYAVTLNPGAGRYHLFDVQVKLVEYATKIWMLGAGEENFIVPAVKPKRMLPHWKYKGTIHHAGGANTLEVVWRMFLARARTC